MAKSSNVTLTVDLPVGATVTYTTRMKLPSTRSLFVILNSAYALGLLLAIQLSATYSTDAFWGGIMLVVAPIVLTTLLLVGQVAVIRREEAASRAGHGSAATPGHEWGLILLLYIFLALAAAGFRSLSFSG